MENADRKLMRDNHWIIAIIFKTTERRGQVQQGIPLTFVIVKNVLKHCFSKQPGHSCPAGLLGYGGHKSCTLPSLHQKCN
jgi:hypothetical protein